jgi:hypothetical protein
MFDNFRREKRTFPFVLIQIGLFLVILALATFLVGFGIYGVTYCWNQLSTKQKKEQAEILRRQQILRDNIDIIIRREGYLVKESGRETIYVPTIYLEVTNLSNQPVEDFLVSVYFKFNRKIFCHSQIPIAMLMPGQIISLVANCIEWVGFGSVYKGLPLIQTSHQVSYEIWGTCQEIQTQYLEAPLLFQILEQKRQ